MGGSGGGGGKRADWAGMMIAVAAVSLVLEGSVVAAATRHVVGGSGTGWTIPPNASFYGEWSSSQTYVVGDTLVFNFPTGIHNVIQVPKSSYDACTAQNQIGSTLSTGPATVTLTSSGAHYYICGVSGHCSTGQKLAITVASSSSAGPAPTPTAGGPTPSGAPAPASSGPSGVSPAASGPSGVSPAASGPSGVSPSSAPPPRPFIFSLSLALLSVASSCLIFL
ncbi:cucumber peeling cupredoxin-like [Phoenix dactylifera]|uniref:Cucumber peeling cupredoxin-like n=1 Tax=Phoenix dactylifera TaxID=42345 RepID=A0A8B8ZTM1_PHODC|nr:cucumber peeling cupredoxin-like [Phoenix dactylifera]